MPFGRQIPPSAWEILAGSLILAWRLLAYPANQFWRDWVVIVSLYWIYTALASRTRAWAPVTVAVLAYLLGIYVHGQLPQTLSVLGAQP